MLGFTRDLEFVRSAVCTHLHIAFTVVLVNRKPCFLCTGETSVLLIAPLHGGPGGVPAIGFVQVLEQMY